MARISASKKSDPPKKPDGITKISVAGFKSIVEEQSIEVRPLTILAGANSSGKSSIMQPLLLLKQTLEAPYDPGALRLDGPNVRFTSANQFLSHAGQNKHSDVFSIGIAAGKYVSLTTHFRKQPGKPFEVQRSTAIAGGLEHTVQLGMTWDEIESNLGVGLGALLKLSRDKGAKIEVIRDRFFLIFSIKQSDDSSWIYHEFGRDIEPYIRETIHIPGLRGNPERTYVVAAVGKTFPGTFENYVASVIAKWQADDDNDNLEGVSQDLKELGLTRRAG